MTETLLKYFQLLKTEKLLSSQAPKALLDNNDFQNMLDSGILLKLSAGRGYVYELNEEKRQVFENWFAKKFPNADIEVTDRASSIAKFRDSKQHREKDKSILFLRGKQNIRLNNTSFSLFESISPFTYLGCELKENEFLEAENVCFIENKEAFLKADLLLPPQYTFVHPVGRIGDKLLGKIKTENILFFPDYDYVGLNEYFACRSIFSNTELFFPDNYDFLFDNYKKHLNLNRKKGQRPSKKVLDAVSKGEDDRIIKVFNNLQSTQHFLEQESLLINL